MNKKIIINSKEKALECIHDKDFADNCKVFIHDNNNIVEISLSELIDKIGEDKVADMLLNFKQHEISDVDNHFYDILYKIKTHGIDSLTKEEADLLKSVEVDIPFINSNKNFLLEAFCKVAASKNSSMAYNRDIFGFCISLMETATFLTGSYCKEYSNDPSTLIQIIKRIGDDILKTWLDSLKENSNIPKDLVMLGFIYAIDNYFFNDDISKTFIDELFPINDIAKIFNLDIGWIRGCGKHCNSCDFECDNCSYQNTDKECELNLNNYTDDDILDDLIDIIKKHDTTNTSEKYTESELIKDVSNKVKEKTIDIRNKLKHS